MRVESLRAVVCEVSGWAEKLICVNVRVTVPGSVQAETAWLLPTQSPPADLAHSGTIFV